MEKEEKQYFTYKEILLAIREQVLKNEKLLKELNKLISIEKNVGSYRFDDKLRGESQSYKIRLIADEITKSRSTIKVLFNRLTDYKFDRASINKFHMYNVVDTNGKYNLKLVYTSNLDKDYFGTIEILDEEKFASIINELNNSKLSKITEKGIHVNNNLFIQISDFIGIVNGKNSIHYAGGIDGLKVELTDKDFYDVLNAEISASLLPNEVIDLISNSNYNEIDIKFIESKGVPYNYYRFNESGQKLILERKPFRKK
jgi:hypothetical protein